MRLLQQLGCRPPDARDNVTNVQASSLHGLSATAEEASSGSDTLREMGPRVVHGTHDSVNGGAGRAAQRIADAVDGVGAEAIMVNSPARWTVSRWAEHRLSHWQGSRPGRFRSSGLVPGPSARKIQALNPDVVHLHWIGRGFLSSHQVGRLPVPVVWTLHDMWPFCANEHYSDVSEAAGWRRGYSTEGVKTDRWARLAWRAKHASWRDNFTFIAPSQWMADLKSQSALLPDSPVAVVPNPVPIDTFQDMDRTEARSTLGIPAQGPLIGFVADEGAANPLKGFDDLARALTPLASSHPSARLLIVGKQPSAGTASSISTIATGQIRDDARLAIAYAACDVVCVPSLLDNAPQTASEASATSRPVVAYASGGIPDLIQDGVTGLLARTGDVRGLSLALAHVLDSPAHAAQMGRQGRQRAVDEWSPPVIGEKYLRVYREAIERSSPPDRAR